jgi:type I restriction enzyme S subunit
MSEWKEIFIDSACSRLSSGKSISSSLIKDKGDYPVYGGNGIRGFTNTYNFDGECAIIGRQGASCGNVRFFSGKAYMTEHAVVAVPTKEHNAYYLSCVLASLKLGRLSGQSAQPGIGVGLIGKQTITMPSLATQQKIASILSSLDDKIAVNRRICENLEAQAQALFKHWFIDFAPFKNGKFVESELGMIPEGWRVGTYSDIIQETISGDWGKEKEEGNYTHKVACIRGCDFQDVKMGLRGKTPERFILEKNYQTKHFEDKDVLVEISGGTATVSTGRICPVSQLLIDKYEGDIVCTNFCRLVRPIKGYSSYLYYSWKYKYDHKVMFGYENGTSGIKNFSIKDFSSREPLILPELSALNEFENIIDHIHTQIQNCGSESAKLTSLRDTLLPKLMSGEIKV